MSSHIMMVGGRNESCCIDLEESKSYSARIALEILDPESKALDELVNSRMNPEIPEVLISGSSSVSAPLEECQEYCVHKLAQDILAGNSQEPGSLDAFARIEDIVNRLGICKGEDVPAGIYSELALSIDGKSVFQGLRANSELALDDLLERGRRLVEKNLEKIKKGKLELLRQWLEQLETTYPSPHLREKVLVELDSVLGSACDLLERQIKAVQKRVESLSKEQEQESRIQELRGLFDRLRDWLRGRKKAQPRDFDGECAQHRGRRIVLMSALTLHRYLRQMVEVYLKVAHRDAGEDRLQVAPPGFQNLDLRRANALILFDSQSFEEIYHEFVKPEVLGYGSFSRLSGDLAAVLRQSRQPYLDLVEALRGQVALALGPEFVADHLLRDQDSSINLLADAIRRSEPAVPCEKAASGIAEPLRIISCPRVPEPLRGQLRQLFRKSVERAGSNIAMWKERDGSRSEVRFFQVAKVQMKDIRALPVLREQHLEMSRKAPAEADSIWADPLRQVSMPTPLEPTLEEVEGILLRGLLSGAVDIRPNGYFYQGERSEVLGTNRQAALDQISSSHRIRVELWQSLWPLVAELGADQVYRKLEAYSQFPKQVIARLRRELVNIDNGAVVGGVGRLGLLPVPGEDKLVPVNGPGEDAPVPVPVPVKDTQIVGNHRPHKVSLG